MIRQKAVEDSLAHDVPIVEHLGVLCRFRQEF
ncbi:hypothetical protein AAY23_113212, partial [Frankia casuarinae]